MNFRIGFRKKMENFKKLDYILDTHMNATDVTQAFGFKSETMLSKLRKGKTNITKLHIDGLEKYFNIPSKIFNTPLNYNYQIDKLITEYQIELYRKKEKKVFQKKILQQLKKYQLIPPQIFTKEFRERGELDSFIREYKKDLLSNSNIYTKFSTSIFPINNKLFNSLKGVWYGYVYPSNPLSAQHGIWEVETTIFDDYSVVDYWGNAGYLKIGKNESLIIKESYDHEDLTLIRFSNRQVASGIFHFVIVSNQNHTLYEMVNFGFFSRKQYPLDEAKEILGERESKQLKLDLEFNEKLIERAIVPQ